jgi:hypothetical protein
VIGSRGFLDAGWTDPVGRWVVRAWWLVLPWATGDGEGQGAAWVVGTWGVRFGRAPRRAPRASAAPGFDQLTT